MFADSYFSGLFIPTSQIKPPPQTLNAQIKIPKENESITPVVNNTQAPTYKFTQFLSTKVKHMLQLSGTFVIFNSTQLTRNLSKIKIRPITEIMNMCLIPEDGNLVQKLVDVGT
jgi:hypothetical protein